MYLCGECGNIFYDLKRVVERHGQDTPPFEILYVCPLCYGGDVSEAVACDRCGEYVASLDAWAHSGMKVCYACYSELDEEEDL